MKRAFAVLLITALLLLCGCSSPAVQSVGAPSAEPGRTEILLKDGSVTVKGGGARADGSIVTISAAGSYAVFGRLSDGQIIVDTGEDALDVTLVLEGAEITNSSGPALWVRQAKNLYLHLGRDTKNLLCSGSEADLASFDGTASGAALYAEDDLKISGGGSLEVLGYLNNGVACKDDLEISGGTLSVRAANHGVKASESIEISGGTVSVDADNDGLKTSSVKKEGKGFIDINGGTVTVLSRGDGISAAGRLELSGGNVSVHTRAASDGRSCKGLKAPEEIKITGGFTEVVAEDDDGIRSEGDLLLTGGTVSVSAVTGLQSGDKDSGVGDIRLSGGSLAVCADKQALKAAGSIYADCRLMALCGSEKQAAPAPGGRAFLLASVSGRAGDLLWIGLEHPDSGGFQAVKDFRTLLYVGDDLTPGEAVQIFVEDKVFYGTAQ